MSRRRSAPIRLAVAIALLSGSAVAIAQNLGGAVPGDAAHRALVTAARGEQTRAQGVLRAAEARVRAGYKAQPELLAAEKAQKDAQVEFEACKKPVIAKLGDDPEYKQEKQTQDDLEAKIQAEHAKAVAAQPETTRPAELPKDRKPDDDKTVTAEKESLNVPVPTDAGVVAAVDKANQRGKLRELEAAAIAKDPNTTAAQAKVQAADDKLKALQLEYRAVLLNDPDYKGALDQVNAARARVIEAGGADTGGDNGGYGGNGGYGNGGYAR